jgi:hypothetical protein
MVSALVYADDGKMTVDQLINKRIVVSDHWAGQGFILKKEKGEFVVVREIFGSGVPVMRTITYKAVKKSDYQVVFSEVILVKPAYGETAGNPLREEFILTVDEENNAVLYLNGLKVVIVRIS